MIRPLLLILIALLAVPATAQSFSQQPNTRIEIIAESTTPAAGQPVAIGLVLTPKPGWHTYWSNPGDAGAPTRVEWTVPAGTAQPGPLAYPLPETLVVSGLMNYVYPNANVLLTTVTPPADMAKGTAFPVKVKADWLVCSMEQCVPESATVTLPLTIGKGDTDPDMGFRIAAARAAVPKPVQWPATWKADGGRFVLSVPFGSTDKVTAAYFFPEKEGVVDFAAPQTVTIAGEALRIETAAATPPPSGPVTGVLRVVQSDMDHALGFAITANPGAVPAAGLPLGKPDDPIAAAPTLLPILLAAIVGGIILNIMPCVFPILSLKALSLSKANVDAGSARRDALAYTAGIVLVCTALGGLVLLLRAAGSQVGWAFQLQDPRVITFLLLLVTAIALNLAGVFEITASTGSLGDETIRKGGALGSFATGALAAFVATPCTGPFMAGALGAALVLPPVAALAVFAGLGLGLALPFLAIGFIPALRRRLPRPGAWMNRLRAILSVPMFLTALALAWVLGRQAGVEGMTAGVAGALITGLLLWWLGSRQHGGGGGGWLPASAAIAAGVAAILLLPVGEPAAQARGTSAPAGLMAEPYTPERLAALRSSRKPVFLYMTADWCLTCKVNERGAMADAEVARTFRAKGITVLEGDWTRGDAVISKWLAERGRAGVPVYVFYGADGRDRELPQILTVDALTSLG
ncbi:protein-disulfide reductase DsbD family protein [Polymorphobacter fuscus]|uniref:Thiol:disulfide interchange protein n=1 Tax=Sandarakinorhabdus fusca TaxID=1439888 RepID=A0A7C9KIH3_9SPHN|nr:thioredoxin family protein [Polymorphobacter fuscus]KAB7646143.1 thiol:disulfide interchange protein [Polymorphobacter fuscus]MQT17341.1 thiol:disulfide interchange protein [Polymorphobacter fuscus]NJC10126.1 thiol:disulfide interchange protein [Polymorphobacter fuscus]